MYCWYNVPILCYYVVSNSQCIPGLLEFESKGQYGSCMQCAVWQRHLQMCGPFSLQADHWSIPLHWRRVSRNSTLTISRSVDCGLLQKVLPCSSIPSRQSRLYLLKGGTHTIPNISLKGGGSLSLKLYCAAAIAPHLPLRNGRKIPANRLCNSLHISSVIRPPPCMLSH